MLKGSRCLKISKCLFLLIEISFKLNNNMSPIDLKDIYAMQEIPDYIVIGCLMHAMTHTCLDLAYLVGKVAKYMANVG